jgi:hypothetical protein
MKKQTAPLSLLLSFFFSTTSGRFRSAASMVVVVFRCRLMLALSFQPNYMDIGNTLVSQVFCRFVGLFLSVCRCYCWRHDKEVKKVK